MPEVAEQTDELTPVAKMIMARSDASLSKPLSDSIKQQFEKIFPDGVPFEGQDPPKMPEGAPKPEVKADALAPAVEPAKPAAKPQDKPAERPPIPEKLLEPAKPEPSAAPAEDKEFGELTKGMHSNTRQNFEKVYQRAKTAERRATEIEDELAKLKTAPAPKSETTEELATLKKQVEEFDGLLKQTALERHPKFKEYYDGGIDKQVELAKKIAGKHADDIVRILANPDAPGAAEKFEEISAELGALKSQQLAGIATQVSSLRDEKGAKLANWKTELAEAEKIQATQVQTRIEQARRASEQAAGNLIAKAAREIPIFRELEGENEWNAEVRGRMEEIKRIATSELDPESRADLAFAAVSGKKYFQVSQYQTALIAKLRAELNSLKEVEPTVTGSSSTSPPLENDNESVVDRMVRAAVNNGLVQ